MQLFISHSNKDRDWVDQVQKRIEAGGAQAYLAEYDRSGVGHVLNDRLKQAIADSDAVVVLLTANAATSPIVREEIGYALGLSKPIVPLVAPEVASDPAALGMLIGLEYIPFDRDDFQEGLLRLTDVVNDLVRAEREESHLAERDALTTQIMERDKALAQLQSRNDSIQVLLIFVGAIAVVAVMSRPAS
jgi:hypothetical protein